MGAGEGERRRRHRSRQERRQIVEETLKPGASVSRVARAHDVNANLVFYWRKLYREGRLEVVPTSGALVAVKVSNAAEKLQPARHRQEAKLTRAGIIDIDMGHARIRI